MRHYLKNPIFLPEGDEGESRKAYAMLWIRKYDKFYIETIKMLCQFRRNLKKSIVIYLYGIF